MSMTAYVTDENGSIYCKFENLVRYLCSTTILHCYPQLFFAPFKPPPLQARLMLYTESQLNFLVRIQDVSYPPVHSSLNHGFHYLDKQQALLLFHLSLLPFSVVVLPFFTSQFQLSQVCWHLKKSMEM